MSFIVIHGLQNVVADQDLPLGESSNLSQNVASMDIEEHGPENHVTVEHDYQIRGENPYATIQELQSENAALKNRIKTIENENKSLQKDLTFYR